MAAVLIAYPALAIRYADLETALPEIIIILHVTKYQNTETKKFIQTFDNSKLALVTNGQLNKVSLSA